MPDVAVPAEDEDRPTPSRSEDFLNSPTTGAFDRLAALAARLLAVPVAIVSLVDDVPVSAAPAPGPGQSLIKMVMDACEIRDRSGPSRP